MDAGQPGSENEETHITETESSGKCFLGASMQTVVQRKPRLYPVLAEKLDMSDFPRW